MNEILEKYNNRGADPDLSIIFGYFRLELLLSNFFLKLGVSANIITGISFILGMIGCILLSMGNYLDVILGATLLVIWAFLDYIDGNVARKTDTSSKFGGLIDNLNGHIIGVLSLVAIGFGISRTAKFNLTLISDLTGCVNSELVGLMAALLYLMYRLINVDCYLYIGLPDRKSEKLKKKKGFTTQISRLWRFNCLYTPITLVMAVSKMLHLWFIATTVVFIFYGIISSINKIYETSRNI